LFALAALAFVTSLGAGSYLTLRGVGGHASEEVSAVSRTDRTPGPAMTRASSPTPAATPAATPVPPLAGQSFRMNIDSIGVDAPVVTEGLDEDLVPEIPLNGYEVAWYDFSAQPGTAGNAVFAGHKTWAGEAVFFRLDELKAGDTVRLKGENGVELVYIVSESFTVDPDDPNSVQVMARTAGDVLTIITCDGTRYYSGGPLGHDYTERRVVRAVRADTGPDGAG
jgi:LPXTG-site transpeptidase (sortase) family protein